MLSRLSLIWGTSLLTACSTAQINTKDDIVSRISDQWQESLDPQASSLDSQALAAWWSQFNDPTLTALIERALQENTDILIAFSHIQQARAERGLEKTNLLPSLDANLSATSAENYDDDSNAVFHSDAYNASIDLSWEVDLFGRLNQNLKAATAELQATTEDFYAVQVSLTSEVAETYIDLRANEAILDLTQKTVEARQKTWQLIKWKEEAGEADRLDTEQAYSSLKEAQSLIPDLEKSIKENKSQLEILCASFPGELNVLLSQSSQLPTIPALIDAGIPAETLRQRPDVRVAERNIDATTAYLKATERSRLPALTLTGSLGIDGDEPDDLFDLDQLVTNAVAGLTAPIWDAGKIKHNIEIKIEESKQAYYSYQNTVINALSEVETALHEVKTNQRKETIIAEATASAQRLLVLSQMQYEAGSTDFIDVLDAQRTALSMQQEQISTQADNLASQIHLYKSLGGGWGE